MKKLDPRILDWKKKIRKNRIEFLKEFKSPKEFKEFLKELRKENTDQINENVQIVFKSLGIE